MTKDYLYSIPSECSWLYKGKTCFPLKIRIQEHIRGDIDKLSIADPVWKNIDHIFLWNEVKIIDNTTRK